MKLTREQIEAIQRDCNERARQLPHAAFSAGFEKAVIERQLRYSRKALYTRTRKPR